MIRIDTGLACICLIAGFALVTARPLVAATPPGCSKHAVRGALVATDEQSQRVALHLSGGWGSEGPPEELLVRHAVSGEERILTRLAPRPLAFPRDQYLAAYRVPDDGLAAGRWQTSEMDFQRPVGANQVETDSGFYVFEPSSSSLVLEVEVEASFQRLHFVDRQLTSFARSTLLLTIATPAAWLEGVPDDALLGVRLGVDAVPDDSAELAEDDRFIVANQYGRGSIVLSSFMSDFCFSSITADWVDGTTLHGLLWPIGQDPAQVSMRFTLELADLRTEVTRLHDETFQMGTTPDASEPDEPESAEPDAGDAAELEADAARGISANPETSSTGCAALPTRSRAGVGAALAFLAIALLRRRVLRLRSP